MPAVEAVDVVLRVRDGATRRTVIDGVSLRIDTGELVVLRGPSGSGKTTLLGLLGAMLLPTRGEILIDGEPTSRLRDEHRAEVRRHKVGFVFQDVQLVDGMSAIDNVLLPCVPDGIADPEVARAHELLKRFGLESSAGKRVRQLSGGERQRVALARGLVRNPKVLLLDEPTAHLDDARTSQVADELASLAREGRAVIAATHDSRVADAKGVTRVIDVHDGKVS